jgi:hypothetical protein
MGDDTAALAILSEHWRRYRASGLERIQVARVLFTSGYVRAHLGAAALTKRAPSREVDKLVTRLEREDLPWCRAVATSSRAGFLLVSGKRKEAKIAYERAAVEFDAVDMVLNAACCRFRADELGGREAAVSGPSVTMAFSDACIKSPERWSAILAPRI